MEKRLISASLAGLIALLLFAPITGMVLSGYTVISHWQRPLVLAGIVFLGHLVFSLFRDRFLKIRTVNSRAKTEKTDRRLIVIGLLLALAVPFFIGKYGMSVAILALIYILLALGLNIVVGLAGLLDLGFVAFYAVGAYGYALGYHYLQWSFWLALPFSALLAACFGMVLGFPVLRMHGDYLAIVTLGFGEIIRLILNNWVGFTGGPNGISAPFPTFFGWEFSRRATQGGTPIHTYFNWDYSSSYRNIFLYLVLLLVVCAMVYFVARLKQMPIGRAWEALRNDETACRSLGINHVVVKLSAFSLGAMVGGIGGVFFAASQGFVNPTSFTFFESAHILAIVVLGGMGSTTGIISAALILTVAPEVLRVFADYRVLMVGIAMVMMMIWRPNGLLRSQRPVFTVLPQEK